MDATDECYGIRLAYGPATIVGFRHLEQKQRLLRPRPHHLPGGQTRWVVRTVARRYGAQPPQRSASHQARQTVPNRSFEPSRYSLEPRKIATVPPSRVGIRGLMP